MKCKKSLTNGVKSVDEEKTRARDSHRIVEVYEVPKNLNPSWIGAGCVIKVERRGTRGSEPYSITLRIRVRTYNI